MKKSDKQIFEEFIAKNKQKKFTKNEILEEINLIIEGEKEEIEYVENFTSEKNQIKRLFNQDDKELTWEILNIINSDNCEYAKKEMLEELTHSNKKVINTLLIVKSMLEN